MIKHTIRLLFTLAFVVSCIMGKPQVSHPNSDHSPSGTIQIAEGPIPSPPLCPGDGKPCLLS